MSTTIHTFVLRKIILSSRCATHTELVEITDDYVARRSMAYKYLGKRATHELFAPIDTKLRKELLAALALAACTVVDKATVFTFPDGSMLEIHSDDQWMWNNDSTLIISDHDGIQESHV